MPIISRPRHFLAHFVRLLTVIVLCAAPGSARDSKDTIFFKNGDKWTCEIKKMDLAYLYVSVDYVDGTVAVDWSKVSRIESPQMFAVRTGNGESFSGTLQTPEGKAGSPEITISAGTESHTIARSAVTTIDQTEESFWQGIHGTVDGGTNFSKSDAQIAYTLNSTANYRRELWGASGTYQSSFNGSRSGPTNLRQDLSLDALRFLGKKRTNYFGAVLVNVQTNDEQQLELRTTWGTALGYLIKDSSRARIYLSGGAAFTRERYTSTPEPQQFNSAEGTGTFSLEYFRFKTTDFKLVTTIFPSLSDMGRIRMTSNASVKFEIVKNLYWNFSAYLNYDSHPPSAVGTAKSDYGTSGSLGWSF